MYVWMPLRRRFILFNSDPTIRSFVTCGKLVTLTEWHNMKRIFLQGMGGQLNYFGFWLDDDFGSGHSRGQPSCTTYGSPQLSAEEEFKLDKLEAWGVGVPPENEVNYNPC